MMVRKIKFQDELYAVLTPEQREKADKLGYSDAQKLLKSGLLTMRFDNLHKN